MTDPKTIFVTQPELPPLEEFTQSLKEIWDNKIITNNGPFHQKFEKCLAEYLDVDYLSLFANGTLALMTALQALRITGEVITTPFSFVATTHSLWWNNIKPVFADIEPESFNLDPIRVESAITPHTTAIMPVHVYGNPCNLEAFQKISDTYGIKLIYDAAHAFGVKVNGESIVKFGDLSVLSFHATKVFNTIEGGAIICPDHKTKSRIDFLKNFGFANETTVIEPGINAKMNELQAAYGLLQLNYVDRYISERKAVVDIYCEELINVSGIRIFNKIPGIKHNYSYFPILVDKEKYGRTRDDLYTKLKLNGIFGRRYFYPLISQFPTYKGMLSSNPNNLPNAERTSGQIICLPLYPGLDKRDIKRISLVIKDYHG